MNAAVEDKSTHRALNKRTKDYIDIREQFLRVSFQRLNGEMQKRRCASINQRDPDE